MKKLSKLVLREYIEKSDLIGKKAQRNILGGTTDSATCCVVTSHYTLDDYMPCYGDRDCESLAGDYGWWCCNCPEAKAYLGC